jgi:D-3-phosphoglycerate dehydrogenase
MKVLVSDPISEKGLNILRRAKGIKVEVKTGLPPERLHATIKDCHGLIIRSATKVTADIVEAASKLMVIGRAGIGLDNVDIGSATKKGIVVMNAPEGNVITTAEHTISMMLALARNIPQATSSMKRGLWEKKRFQGTEIFNKTLGIVGVGRIGKVVANRARGLKMNVVGFDPYIPPDILQKWGVEPVSVDELYKRSDFITVHTPKTKETTRLIDRGAFRKMKKGVKILNCARGGIVDEKALYKAIVDGKVSGAALDVFEQEPPEDNPLLNLDNVICTPHLGASTAEAQENVAVNIAEQIIDYLLYGVVRNAVNVPSVSAETMTQLSPYLVLAERLGSFHTQMAKGGIREVSIKYIGDVAGLDIAPITISVLKGLLTPVLGHVVNFVNAPVIAKERGIKIVESKASTANDFTNLITLNVKTTQEENTLSGTIFGKKEPRIVRINSFRLEAAPEGHMLLIQNVDRPGVIGSIGVTLGRYKINIARMQVGQEVERGNNITLLNTSSSVSKRVLTKILDLPYVVSAIPLDL